MEDKYFKPAGNLDGNKNDLLYSKNIRSDLNFFRKSGDIELEPLKERNGLSEVSGFRPAGDLIYDNDVSPIDMINIDKQNVLLDMDTKKENMNTNNSNFLDDYLLTIVSGKKYDAVCELGVLMGSGRIIVSLEELRQMVDEGYNIVSANVIGPNMIEIEFQKYIYNQELMERRSRF